MLYTSDNKDGKSYQITLDSVLINNK